MGNMHFQHTSVIGLMKLPVQTADAYPDQRAVTANAMANAVRRKLGSFGTAFE